MTTMLEKMAEAIGSQMAEDDNDNIDIARAALQAIREPNEAMMLAYYDLTGDSGELTGDATATSAFTAMIDAILEGNA